VKVLRSFYYYLLIDNYGDAPYLTSAKNAPAKPFKIKRAAIFDSLVSTIKTALPSLITSDKKTMVTRYMAYALLAKLYLNAEIYTGTAHWEEAGNYCDSVFTGPYTPESDFLAPFKTNNDNSSEIIFSIPYDEDNFQGFRLHMRTLHYQMDRKYDMPVGPWNGFAIVPDFFDKYDSLDKRRAGYNIYGLQYDIKGKVISDGETHMNLNIAPHLAGLNMQPANTSLFDLRCSGARVGKYEIKIGAKENLSNDFPLFRLTDFKLMKAEVLIRLNGDGAGDELIKPIRSRAGVAGVEPLSGWTLEQLLAERGRELYCEGHRRQDLIRFHEYGKAKWKKTADASDKTTFPIPKWATDANSNLLLNP
jgi:starch-binding outer membrane protein, SusD/RagB family